MKHRFLMAAGALLSLMLAGCGTSSPVVATVGNEDITLRDFESSYAKNNGGWDAAATSTLADRQKFLDLLVKFRLKVREARDKGLERDSAVQDELNTYRLSVAQSYMLEKELVEPNVQRLYDRKKEEIRISHILFRISVLGRPQDTLEAYNRAMEAIHQIPTTPFDTLADRYSNDPSVANNHGDLGYFSTGRMVPEFEDACYALNPGQYTPLPVRTQFGYHVIMMTGRRPNLGSVHIAHILLRYAQNRSDTAAIRDTAWMVYRKIKAGMPFGEAASRYSMDPGSAGRDGDIGEYERGMLPANLQDLLFTAAVDSLLEPVQFPYGFHIFKVLGRKPVPPFAELEKSLKDTYQQQRYQADYRTYVRNLRQRYAVTLDSTVLRDLAGAFDTTMTPSHPQWADTVSAALRAQVLIRAGKDHWSVQQVLDRIGTNEELKGVLLTPERVRVMVDKVADGVALELHARTVPLRHPEFAELMKEYEEGILLYRVEQDEVWKKLAVNDSILHAFYDETKEKYRWPDRINVGEIYLVTDSAANACYQRILKGEPFDSVAAHSTVRPGYRDKLGHWGLLPITSNDLTRRAALMAADSVTPPFRFQSGYSIITVVGRDSARVKTFDEAAAEVAGAYQDVAAKAREAAWMNELKQKYPVVMHDGLLGDAFKKRQDQ